MKKLLLFTFFALSLGMNAQTITSVTPNTGDAGETLQVTITGNNTEFLSISGPGAVYFYNTAGQSYFFAISMDLISDTVANFMVDIPNSAATGNYTLSLYDENNSYTLPNAFFVTNNNNTITGTITVDTNNNGCDGADPHPGGIKVVLDGTSNDTHTFTDSAGHYTFYVGAGNFTVTPEPEMPYFSSTPPSATLNFPTVNSLNQTANFCIAPNGVHNDLTISILPIMVARPGFDASYRLAYRNNGNQVLSGSVNFVFDDSRLDFVSANPTLTAQTANNLYWNFTNLMPFEMRYIDVVVNVNSPMETPAVNIGDMLFFSATVNPVAGDETPADNVSEYNQTVVGSFDPNDKAVTEGSQIALADVDEYLHYLIRFQNSGNFLAENIRVEDFLSANLDASTLEVVSTSHPYRSTLTQGNRLQFFFDNINLPPESENEPGSHGFIAFKIKPVSTLVVGNVIENTADIYFDFNFPIVTNTVSTTVALLGNPDIDFDNAIRLYPNPAGNVLTIENLTSSEIMSVKIFNQLGQLVKAVDDFDASPRTVIAVDGLTTGTYFVKVNSNNGTATKKLIKL
jgi:uncharacterized repeat protein (TIGR01451 family)